MRRFLFALIFLYVFLPLSSQQKVSFYSDDSLKITADLYLKDINLPFILLFHQGNSSRGEFAEIAVRLMKLNYNCLAVDLRSGDKINYTMNETARRATNEGYESSMISASRDIKAALNYVQKYNGKPSVLFGSSYSASLCLLEAAGNEQVKAVVAMSPGEYFRPDVIVKNNIGKISQPMFVSATRLENDFILEMLADVPEENIHYFLPSRGRGDHGAKMLWKTSESSSQCWLELMLFFKKIRYD